MHRTRRLVFPLSILLIGACVATAATRYVMIDNPTPEAPFESWATAATNIQDAVDEPGEVSLIIVSNGVFAVGGRTGGTQALTNRLVIDRAVTVQSLNGPENTFIVGAPHSGSVAHGDAAIRCVYLGHADAVISGFTLTNGHTRALGNDQEAYGGAVWAANTSPIVTNCVIIGNRANTRAGGTQGATVVDSDFIGNQSASAGAARESILRRCNVISNTGPAHAGGTINSTVYDSFFEGNIGASGAMFGGAAHNSIFIGNKATGNGGATAGASLNNCLLMDNEASGSGGATSGGTLRHCTIVGNRALVSGGGTSGSTLFNCIVYYNEAPLDPNWVGGGNSRYTIADPMTSGGGDVAGPPGIIGINNPRLLPNSPAIDAGSDGMETTGTHDVEGNPRTAGAAPDMGAYEYTPGTHTGALTAAVSADQTTIAQGSTLVFTADVQGRAKAVIWSFGDGTPDLTNVCAVVGHTFMNTGMFPVTVTATNSDAVVVSAAHTVTVIDPADAVAFVNIANPTPAHPYATWGTAATNIQDAVDAVTVGGTVWVTNGIYDSGSRAADGAVLQNRVVVDKAITVRSVNGPAHTQIVGVGPRGETAVRGVWLADGATLIGFTVTNGNTRIAGAADPWSERSGGGILAATTAVISNCVVVSGAAHVNGGGIAGGIIWNSEVRDGFCPGGNGAGISHATVYNSLIADGTASDGGGTFASHLINCVVSNNTATSGGGGMRGGSAMNSIIIGNTSPRGGGVYQSTVYNSLIIRNEAYASGAVTGWGGGSRESLLVNCTVTLNECISPDGRGGGTYLGTVTNSIVWGNIADDGPEYWGAATFVHSCTTPLPGGAGNIDDDPLFQATTAGDFRLRFMSPAIDAGTNQAWMVDAVDLAGTPRLLNGNPFKRNLPAVVDMGAYEFDPPIAGMMIRFR